MLNCKQKFLSKWERFCLNMHPTLSELLQILYYQLYLLILTFAIKETVQSSNFCSVKLLVLELCDMYRRSFETRCHPASKSPVSMVLYRLSVAAMFFLHSLKNILPNDPKVIWDFSKPQDYRHMETNHYVKCVGQNGVKWLQFRFIFAVSIAYPDTVVP